MRRLVLVGGAASGPSYLNAPGALWNRSHPKFWKLALLGILYLLIRRLASQNHLFNLIEGVSYFKPRPEAQTEVRLADWFKPAFPRTRWADYAQHQDFRSCLKEVKASTLVVEGQYDPQCPSACSKEMTRSIRDSRLVLFEESGYYAFIEELERFAAELRSFLIEGL